MRRAWGFTLLELLVVLGIIGILMGLTAFQYRRIEAQQAKASFYTGIQRLFWEGATAAASRGQTLELVRQGNRLIVRTSSPPYKTLRTLDIPEGVEVDLPDGSLADFTPPGRVRFQGHFPKDCGNGYAFRVKGGKGQSRCYRVSYIGEVQEVRP